MPTRLEGIPREAQHALLQRPCKALIPIQSQKQLNSFYHPSCHEINSPPTPDLFCMHLSTSKCTKIVFMRRVPFIIMFPRCIFKLSLLFGVFVLYPSCPRFLSVLVVHTSLPAESNWPGAVYVSVNTCFRWDALSVLRDQMIQQGSK